MLIGVFVSMESALADNGSCPVRSTKAETAATHESFIRQAFDLARSAEKKGNHPFGALLVYQDKVVLAAENTVNTDNNSIHHAETNLMAEARRKLSPEIYGKELCT